MIAGARVVTATTLAGEVRRMVVWSLLIVALPVTSAVAFPHVLTTVTERRVFAAAVSTNPAFEFLFGRASDLTTVDGFATWRSLALGGVATGLLCALVVVRTTRGQEESGCAELIAAAPVGRAVRTVAALACAVVGVGMVAVLTATLTVAAGGGLRSSLVLAAGFAVSGLLAAGVAAVTARLAAEARTASIMAVSVLLAGYVGRGVAAAVDAPRWASLVNPLAWIALTDPAGSPVWWPLVAGLALTLGLLAVAVVLERRTDVGSGVIQFAAGPARGRIHTLAALLIRRHRAVAVAALVWAVVMSVAMGGLASQVPDLLRQNPSMADIFAARAGLAPDALRAAFLTSVVAILGIVASAVGTHVVVRLHGDETAHVDDLVLSAPVARTRLLLTTVAVAAGMTAGVMVVIGGVLGVYAELDLQLPWWRVVLQALAAVPAVWTVVAVAAAVVGGLPGAVSLAWVPAVGSFVLTDLGPAIDLPSWLMAASPFEHLPDAFGGGVDAGLWIVCVVGVTAILLAAWAFRHRDIG